MECLVKTIQPANIAIFENGNDFYGVKSNLAYEEIIVFKDTL